MSVYGIALLLESISSRLNVNGMKIVGTADCYRLVLRFSKFYLEILILADKSGASGGDGGISERQKKTVRVKRETESRNKTTGRQHVLHVTMHSAHTLATTAFIYNLQRTMYSRVDRFLLPLPEPVLVALRLL